MRGLQVGRRTMETSGVDRLGVRSLCEVVTMETGSLLWPCAPPDNSIQDGEIHVFAFSTSESGQQVAEAARRLPPDEQAVAARFQSNSARSNFIICRWTLRRLLARHVGRTPESIQLGRTRHGKPFVANPHQTRQMHFNVSHTDGLALIGLSPCSELGVDAEQISQAIDVETIVQSAFSVQEASVIESAPLALRVQTCLRLWTRKEATLKASGIGLSDDPRTIDVSSTRNVRAKLRLSLVDLRPTLIHLGAVAYYGAPQHVRCWSLARK